MIGWPEAKRRGDATVRGDRRGHHGRTDGYRRPAECKRPVGPDSRPTWGGLPPAVTLRPAGRSNPGRFPFHGEGNRHAAVGPMEPTHQVDLPPPVDLDFHAHDRARRMRCGRRRLLRPSASSSLPGAARFANRSCNWSTNAAVTKVPRATVDRRAPAAKACRGTACGAHERRATAWTLSLAQP